jgi:hypothetical protein
MTSQGYLQARARLARAVGVSCAMRHIFNAAYPSMDQAVFAKDDIPFLHSSFDHGEITVIGRTPFAAFRMSPNVEGALGPRDSMAIAIVAKTLVSNMECMRRYLEVMVLDEDAWAGRERESAADLLAVRAPLEERFARFAPPIVASEPEIAEEWLAGLEECLAHAADPGRQPPEAVPWF